MKQFRTCLFAALLLALPMAAFAQSRPLVTQDPETVGAGQILFETGFDYSQNVVYPASGLHGNLVRIAPFNVSFGVSSIAEIQLGGGIRNRLAIRARDSKAPLAFMLTVPATAVTTSDFEDAVIGAKIKLCSETAGRPSIAIRFQTKLPNAQNESGLGLDTTDFLYSFLLGKTVQSIRIVGNLGFAILGDPTRGDRQNDVLTYGASVARAVAQGVEFVAEINGRQNTRAGTPPVGTENHSVMRVGSRFTRGPVRLDAAFFVGVTKNDPTWGVTSGLTWVFNAFTVK